MADHGVSGNFCFDCRSRMRKDNRPAPCDVDNICWLTKRDPEDEDAPMVSTFAGQFIIDLWERIAALSPFQRIEHKRDEKTMMIHYLPTLEKMKTVLDEVDWQTAPLDRFNTVEWIGRFHQWYLNYKMT
jgi:hypothetical protein